jgi:hypothetical protein
MKTLNLLLLVSAFLLASCGQSNQVNTSGVVSTNPAVTTGVPGTINPATQSVSAIVASIESQTGQCSSGARIRSYFQADSVVSVNTITGQFQAMTTPASGAVSDYYVGVSTFNDLMVVTKMSGGSYAITLSMCPFGSTYTAARPAQQLGALSGQYPYYNPTQAQITLMDSTTSEVGEVYALNTALFLPQSQYLNETWFGPTTFFPAQLNSGTYMPNQSGYF